MFAPNVFSCIFALMTKKILFTCFFIVCVICLSNAAPPPPPGGGPGCWPPPCIPVDGGIGLLVAAGVAYGAKKFLGAKKNNL